MYRAPLLILIIVAFIINTLGPLPVYAQEFVLPKPGSRISLSPAYNPSILKGIKVDANNPFHFEFILDPGDEKQDDLKQQANQLIRYFLASVTTPNKDLWVNLSPYEKDRIIPEAFGQTEMGRDLLAQDYILKQITASLMYPEDEVGKKFWKRIYDEAAKKYGTTNIPVSTFNKVWIVPEKAEVYEGSPNQLTHNDSLEHVAYITQSKLKVMLESDYLAITKNQVVSTGPVPATTPLTSVSGAAINDETLRPYKSSELGKLALPVERAPASGPPVHVSYKNNDEFSKTIIREIILPALEKEVNEGKNFAQLRQIYHSLVLASWYKQKIKNSIMAKVYGDKNKVAGLSAQVELQTPDQIYQQYLLAFKKGAVNYVKEEIDPISKHLVPKKYFSGGFNLDVSPAMAVKRDKASITEGMIPKHAKVIDVDMAMSKDDKAQRDEINRIKRLLNELKKKYITFQKLEMSKASLKKDQRGDIHSDDREIIYQRAKDDYEYSLLEVKDQIRRLIGHKVDNEHYKRFILALPFNLPIDLKNFNDSYFDSIGKEIRALVYEHQSGYLEELIEEKVIPFQQLLSAGYIDLLNGGYTFITDAAPSLDALVRLQQHAGSREISIALIKGKNGKKYVSIQVHVNEESRQSLFATDDNSISLGHTHHFATPLEASNEDEEEFLRDSHGNNKAFFILAVNRQLNVLQMAYWDRNTQRVEYMRDPRPQGQQRIKTKLIEYGLVQDAAMAQELGDLSQEDEKVADFQGMQSIGQLFDTVIFANSNESHYGDVLEILRQQKDETSKGLHIGVSGMQNLDMMAARSSQWGMLIDINKRSAEFFRLIKGIFLHNPQVSRKEFKQELLRQMDSHPLNYRNVIHYYFASPSDKTDLLSTMDGEGSWLASEDRFNHIKQMFIEGRIAIISGNIGDENLFKQILQWMRKYGVRLDTFYVSNTSDYAKMRTRSFLNNIHTLSDDRTLILDSSKDLNLRIKKKSDYKVPDAAMAAIITDFQALHFNSGFTGEDDTIYANSNESNYQTVLESIRKARGALNGGVHIGVSGIQNLDMMAARRSQWGVLIDINKRTGEFFELIGRIFQRYPAISREEFKARLVVEMNNYQVGGKSLLNYFFNSRMSLINFKDDINQEYSWLADDDRFEYIKQLFLKDRIVTINGNIADQILFAKIADWARKYGVRIDTLYLSNVLDWVRDTNEQDLYQNIMSVADDQTIILDSANPEGVHLLIRKSHEYSQRIINKKMRDIDIERLHATVRPGDTIYIRHLPHRILEAKRDSVVASRYQLLLEDPDTYAVVTHHYDVLEDLNSFKMISDKEMPGFQKINTTVANVKWVQFTNRLYQFLTDKKYSGVSEDNKWRLYLKPADRESMAKTQQAVKDIALQFNGPVEFKYLSNQEPTLAAKLESADATRFVINFASREDAIEFYSKLKQRPKYASIFAIGLTPKAKSLDSLTSIAQGHVSERLNGDPAMLENNISVKDLGGIDLTSNDALDIKKDSRIRGNDSFNINPAMLAQLENAPGFEPIIVDIKPLSDVRQYLGVN